MEGVATPTYHPNDDLFLNSFSNTFTSRSLHYPGLPSEKETHIASMTAEGETEKYASLDMQPLLSYVLSPSPVHPDDKETCFGDGCEIPELGLLPCLTQLDMSPVIPSNVSSFYYFTQSAVVRLLTDRLFHYPFVHPIDIPLKGHIDTLLIIWNFQQIEDILPTAQICPTQVASTSGHDFKQLHSSLFDENIIIQRRFIKIPFHFVVRSHLWGSMATAYEKGHRSFCGATLSDTLCRYAPFETPILTPICKMEGELKESNITLEQAYKLHPKAKDCIKLSLLLFQRGMELAQQAGLILIDSKYEFGLDKEHSRIYLIDEVHTPNTSRFCDNAEFEMKFSEIQNLLKNQKYENVTLIFNDKPKLKIRDFSKNMTRDFLWDNGSIPTRFVITQEQISKCLNRYIKFFERFTQISFVKPNLSIPPRQRLYKNLLQAKFIRGCCVIFFEEVNLSMDHTKYIKHELRELEIPYTCQIMSACHQPSKLESMIRQYNDSIEPLVLITCSSSIGALDQIVAALSIFPVIAYPVASVKGGISDNLFSTSSAGQIIKFVLQIFSSVNAPFRQKSLEYLHKFTRSNAAIGS